MSRKQIQKSPILSKLQLNDFEGSKGRTIRFLWREATFWENLGKNSMLLLGWGKSLKKKQQAW